MMKQRLAGKLPVAGTLLCMAVSAVAESDAEADSPLPETHVVQPGETLWDLAERYFGDGTQYWRIWGRTPDLDNPDSILPGQTLRLLREAAPEPDREQLPQPIPAPVVEPEAEPAPEPEPEPEPEPVWGMHFDLIAKPGDPRSLGGGDLFVPLWQREDRLVFADMRGLFSSRSTQELNLGLGYRQMYNERWNLGSYLFADARRTAHDNTFFQANLGLEAISDAVEVRLNGYLPVINRTLDIEETVEEEAGPYASSVEVDGAEIFMESERTVIETSTERRERAYRGADGEIGVRLPLLREQRDMEVRAYAGGYYFRASDLQPVRGPRGRIEARIYEPANLGRGGRVTFFYQTQRDTARGGTQNYAGLRFRMPLQPSRRDGGRMSPQERRMTDPVIRDPDIVVAELEPREVETITQEQLRENVRNVHTGQELEEVAQLEDGDGNNALHDALADGTDLVIVDGGTWDGSFALGSGQTLVGGGHELVLEGAETGTQVNHVFDGDQGEIQWTAGEGLLVDSSSYVGGMAFAGTGGDAAILVQRESDGAVLRGNAVTASAAQGVRIREDVENVRIVGNTLSGTADAAILVNEAESLHIEGNTLEQGQSHGIELTGGLSRNVVIADNSFRDLDGNGIAVASDFAINLAVEGNTMDSLQGHGLLLDEGREIRVTGNSMEQLDQGLRFEGLVRDVEIVDNRITDAVTGLHFLDRGDSVLVEGNRLEGVITGNAATLTGGDFRGEDNTAAQVDGDLCDDDTGTYSGDGFELTLDVQAPQRCGAP